MYLCLKIFIKSGCMVVPSISSCSPKAEFQYGVTWKSQQIQYSSEISSYHRKCITHIYSKLVALDFNILCFPAYILHFISNHYWPPFHHFNFPLLLSYVYFGCTVCIIHMKIDWKWPFSGGQKYRKNALKLWNVKSLPDHIVLNGSPLTRTMCVNCVSLLSPSLISLSLPTTDLCIH